MTTLLHIPIPIHYAAGKTRVKRKLMLNALLAMHWRTRQRIHDEWVGKVRVDAVMALARLPGDSANSWYEFLFTFHPSKSTKVVDIDGFALVGKWAIDVVKTLVGIDDSIAKVKRVSYEVGLRAQEETLTMTLVQRTDAPPSTALCLGGT